LLELTHKAHRSQIAVKNQRLQEEDQTLYHSGFAARRTHHFKKADAWEHSTTMHDVIRDQIAKRTYGERAEANDGVGLSFRQRLLDEWMPWLAPSKAPAQDESRDPMLAFLPNRTHAVRTATSAHNKMRNRATVAEGAHTANTCLPPGGIKVLQRR
jgi:hypothetical protein